MSFSAREIARWLGKPVELFRFTRQSVSWLYTSADREITLGAETFIPLAISRESIKDSYERQKRRITLTLPASAPVCANWHPYPPGDVVAVSVLALHRDESEAAVEWMGRVLQPKFTDAECTLTCDPSSGGARSHGLQLRWTRGCPYALYSAGLCNLAAEAAALPATLTAVAGVTLTADAFATLATGRLAGGFVQWLSADGLVQRRSIMSHAGTSVTVDYGAADLAGGVAVTVYPGCAHTFADCDSKGNSANYGGCTKLPNKNPFGGIPIWW